MANITINLTKWYHLALAALPIMATIATCVMWIDTRYMHKEISDTRFIELQIRIIQAQLRTSNQRLSDGLALSPDEKIQLELDRDQLKFLMSERNKILGIGDIR